jgi:hypothetical protein
MGAYRVDYFNPERFCTPGAVGLYVSGAMSADMQYSKTAKRQLLEGLCYLKRTSDIGNLVAVYLDNLAVECRQRPAFQQMMKDVRIGMLSKIVIHCHAELSTREGFLALIKDHSFKTSGSDLFCWDEKTSFTISFMAGRSTEQCRGDRLLEEKALQMVNA